jgi:hypothetical protein
MEGKNRADYFREEGLPLIPARVSVYTFPRADRIKIYQIRCHGSIEHWAVLDSRWVQKVQHPSWALPLLSAYGVEIGVRWPEHYSTPKEIQVAMFEWSSGPTSPLGSPNWPHQVVVDLMMLSAQIEHQEKMIKSTVMNLRDVSLDVRFWFALVAGVLIGLLGLSAMPVEWSQSRIAAASLMGMSFGALLTVISEIVVTPRKCAVNQPALPPRLSTHNQHRHRSKLPETFQPDQVPLNGNHAHCIDDDLQ